MAVELTPLQACLQGSLVTACRSLSTPLEKSGNGQVQTKHRIPNSTNWARVGGEGGEGKGARGGEKKPGNHLSRHQASPTLSAK